MRFNRNLFDRFYVGSLNVMRRVSAPRQSSATTVSKEASAWLADHVSDLTEDAASDCEAIYRQAAGRPERDV
jgi:hypothetical protein